MPAANPASLSGFPSASSFVVRILIYAAGLLLSGLGGYHGYRRLRDVPFGREQAEAERLRDELVFGDEDARELGVPEDPNPFKPADAPDNRDKP